MAVRIDVKFVFLFVLSPLLKTKSSFLNIEELQKSKYGVEISSEPVLLNNQDKDENIMHMTSKYGQQYQCILPVLSVDDEEHSSKNITTEEIINILEPFNNTCLYFLHGWWTYRTCFGRSVYQYHDDGSQPMKDNTCLGNFTRQTDWSQVNIEEKPPGNGRYHSQFYTNGTVCDLTGEPRKTEVQFYCNEGVTDNIAKIDEPSTCNYVITVHTNKLCSHSLFRPKKSPQKLSINCSPALVEEQYLKYKKMKEEDDDEDEDVNDMLRRTSKEEEATKDKLKPGTPSVFEALGRLFSKGEKGFSQRDEKFHWGDVLKNSRKVIDDSMERITKSQLHKKLEDIEDDDAHEISKEIRTSLKEPSKLESSQFYKAEKEGQNQASKYYEELIEDLKTQYRYFKEEIEIVTKDIHKKLEGFENNGGVNPILTRIAEHLRETVRRFEENQRTLDVEMEKLTNLNEAVMKDRDPALLRKEISSIRTRLHKLMKKINSKDPNDEEVSEKTDTTWSLDEKADLDANDADKNDNQLFNEENVKKDDPDQEENVKNDNADHDVLNEKEIGFDNSNTKKKHKVFDMESPKLDKVVSKLKKIMTQDAEEMKDEVNNEDMFNDDRLSVRVIKVKENDLSDETDKSMFDDDDDENEGGLEEIKGNDEMIAATKKMETIVRKQLQEAGIKHAGKVKVKIITSTDALKRVSGKIHGLQILSTDETNEFKSLFSSLLGGSSDFVKEKERQENLEDNYNLIWHQNGFISAKDDHSSAENENNERKEQRMSI